MVHCVYVNDQISAKVLQEHVQLALSLSLCIYDRL